MQIKIEWITIIKQIKYIIEQKDEIINVENAWWAKII